MDRTVATGTGYIGQYSPAVAAMFESLATCPDDLLLFLHHVPYTHKLHSGKTVIQSLYDSHYDGAAVVEDYVRQWRGLRGQVDEARYHDVLAQLEYQAGQAEVWRDAVNTWFSKSSNIPDAKGRVGHYPGRYEAESMKLEGYTVRDVMPAEDASGGKAVACPAASCAAAISNTMALPDGTRCTWNTSTRPTARALQADGQRTADRRLDGVAPRLDDIHDADAAPPRLDVIHATIDRGRSAAARRCRAARGNAGQNGTGGIRLHRGSAVSLAGGNVRFVVPAGSVDGGDLGTHRAKVGGKLAAMMNAVLEIDGQEIDDGAFPRAELDCSQRA